jgi:hypothetical protein
MTAATEGVGAGNDDRVRSAPLRRLRHPQEESPLWGLVCGLVGAALAVALSLPLLALLALLLPPTLILRAAFLRAWHWRATQNSLHVSQHDSEAAESEYGGKYYVFINNWQTLKNLERKYKSLIKFIVVYFFLSSTGLLLFVSYSCFIVYFISFN